MPYRVAIAAQQGRMVTQHFGRATVFHIFERLGTTWRLAESRDSDPSCRPEGDAAADHESQLALAADLISDCDAVVAARVGPGAVRTLDGRGIEVYAMHALIEDALSALGEQLDRDAPGEIDLEPMDSAESGLRTNGSDAQPAAVSAADEQE